MKNEHQKPKPPRILFQYRKPGDNAFNNLENKVVYFCPPAGFNDPYDCLVPPFFPQMSGKDVERMLDVVKAKHGAEYQKLLDEREESWGELKQPTVNLQLFYMNKLFGVMHECARKLQGVACFSESNDNLPMWSHYAHKGEGFCLEFNTAADPLFADAERVEYSVALPDIDMYDMVADSTKSYKDMWKYKPQDWSYEREWRVFKEHNGPEKYQPEALTAVYLGTQASEHTKDRVRRAIQKTYPDATLWQGRLGERRYAVKFDKFLP